MSMTVVVIVVAVVLLLLVLGVGVIIFVMKKSKGGKQSDSAPSHPGVSSFPPAPQPAAMPPPPQSAPASPPWSQPAEAPAWGAPQESAPPPAAAWGADTPTAPPVPPGAPAGAPPTSFGGSSQPDPYATTPSVDPGDALPNPELFMTTPSVGRGTSAMEIVPAHLQADDGSVIHLTRTNMRVGRHPECDIVVPTPGTSRQHAEFEFRDGLWFVTDLNSGNGTWVNNAKVRSQPLSAGDVVRIDQTRFTFGPGL
jgi:hypothetical protein